MNTLSFLSSNSLFSTIVTFYILIFLYLPSFLLQFILSPVVISTIILLLYLLRLGAEQNSTNESDSAEFNSTESPIHHQILQDHRDHEYVTETEIELESSLEPDLKENPNLFYADSFVEWDVRAPLEVIHEEHGEGEEIEGNGGVSEENRESQIKIIQRYASLSLFYPESDSDASSEENFPTNGDRDCDSPENTCFRWEDEEDRDGLIEIELDEKRNNEVDEENLIEIDLFPAR